MEKLLHSGARRLLAATLLTGLMVPGAAYAQRASENAVTGADDAFGTNLGTETTGIYNENDTRGFSPLKAGNYRLDGIYFDPVATLPGRLRASSSIRVGYSANDYPFPAPTGIVDTRLRSAGEKFTGGISATRSQYGGDFEELDLQIPLIDNHLSLSAGIGRSYVRTIDAAYTRAWGYAIKPVIHWGGAEISPFYGQGFLINVRARPLIVLTGAYLPSRPADEKYLGQTWANGQNDNDNSGVTIKAPITDRISFRGGFFHSKNNRRANFTEIFSVTAPSGLSNHRLISDPLQEVHSWSGEAQLAMRFGGDDWQHRVIIGYRGRDRYTQSGGSDVRDFGSVVLGDLDPEVQPNFVYSAVNVGRVQQSSWMLGYMARIAGFGQINLGTQRARYRASFRDSKGTSQSRDDLWLYNASMIVDVSPALSLFGGSQRGLEDSGVAPENAANRGEQLPATRSTQYEAGLRWNFGPRSTRSHLVISAFQITKPYFSFDAGGRFTSLGTVRHRGIESSLVGRIGARLSLLAGAVLMDPVVSGPGRAAGLAGERPAGTPSVFARIDANYRTDIFGGLTPTVSLIYTGSRAASSKPIAPGSSAQLLLPPHTTLDLGLRQQFKLGKFPASIRAVLQNVFDTAAWKVIASNTLQADERRRMAITLSADF
jgi:iron complex outermembrane receptor protein